MQLNHFDLNLIRALDMLLEERNVTRAAERLHVTQQAMSNSLKRLRDHFGDELLVRVGRGLAPTRLGNALSSPVRELVLQIGLTLHTTASFDPAESDRKFRIALSDYASMVLLPRLMPLLAKHAPNFKCEVLPIDNVVFESVEQGRIDLCVLPSNWRLYQRSLPPQVLSLALFDDDFVCVVSADNLDIADPLSMRQYLASPHYMVRFGGGVQSLIEHTLRLSELDIRIAATTTSFSSLIFMVPGTRMIATAQRRLAERFLGMLPIRLVESPLAIESLQENLSWHERDQNDPAHAFMREMFVLAAREMSSDTS